MNRIKRTIFIKLIAILLVFMSGNNCIFSQTGNEVANKYLCLHWDVNTGLAHDQVYTMLKDIKGFLWIGTKDGLSRFDGNTFKNFFYDSKNKSSIGGSEIHSLKEDSLHNIWIGTDKGLSRFDIKADTFTNFVADAKATSPLNYITPFWVTNDKIYCQETDSLITSYNIHDFRKKIVIHLTAADDIITSHYAKQYFVFDSLSNSVWMQREWRTGRGLCQIDISNGKRTYYNNCHAGEITYYDPVRHSIWLSTEGEGITEFDLTSKTIRQPAVLTSLAKQHIGSHIGMSFDRTGRLWFLSYPSGILIYDPKYETVHPVFENDSSMQFKISDAISCIYCDRDGITWTGSWLRNGVYQIEPFLRSVNIYEASAYRSRGMINDDIINVINGRRNEMWFGTGGGLVRFDTRADSFKTYPIRNLPHFQNAEIASVYADTSFHKIIIKAGGDDREYWLNLDDGLCMPIDYQDENGRPIDPIYSESIPLHYNRSLISRAKNGHKECFFVSDGLAPVAKRILAFPENTIIDFSIAGHLLFIKRPDQMGNLSYFESGGVWVTLKTPMDSVPWTSIMQHKKDSSYWVVAPRELIHYAPDLSLIKKYGLEDGLPHEAIYGLISDNSGNIWFNSNRSIYRLNVMTGLISQLTEKDGFEPSDLRDLGEGIAKDDDGDLYFTSGGGLKGFKRISPDKFLSSPALVYIKSLDIKEFALPSAASANNTTLLSLKHFQNRIDLATGVIDFYSQGNNHIRYKLEGEGRHEDWQIAPGNYNIRYEELAPGRYTLLIQASNAGNEFIGPVKTIAFEITPAFWNTWWFRIAAVLFMIVLVYLVLRWRLQQRFRLKLERSEKEKRILELQQQKTEVEMQALRAQMNPHFIFNSLNSINRFILQNNRTEASEYLTKFSKLVRMILQNSQHSLIPLEAELESLGLYLEMEALRFNHHFEYKINVPKDLDIEILQVPPLIIQPYVENAIWHGLMHKEEKGHLNIDVSHENDHLYFKVSDDGIGRKKASEIAGRSTSKHKSMGLKITAHRIAMMQGSNGEEKPVLINDLVNPDGSAAGTRVEIKMPVIEET